MDTYIFSNMNNIHKRYYSLDIIIGCNHSVMSIHIQSRYDRDG